MNNKESAQSNIYQLRKKIEANGFITSSIELKKYNYEFLIKKGLKTVLQGNDETSLYKQIHNLVIDQQSLVFQEKSINEPSVYIGSDESGKGDVFGPLVIAAFHSTEESRKSLKKLVTSFQIVLKF